MNPIDLFIRVLDYVVSKVAHNSNRYVHGRDRRHELLYKKKRVIVKKIWTGALILIALLSQFPSYAASAVVVAFLATCISFMILDETFDNRKK